MTIRHITLSGTPAEKGVIHGVALKSSIETAIDIYGGFFAMAQSDVFAAAAHFRDVITDFSADYATEIEGIANGAGVDPLWIYALNARSELMSYAQDNPATQVGECTVAYFRKTSVMGQNWDWEQRAEDLIALVTIKNENDNNILMMTEPGIIGKIGMNSAGLGLCFNFLYSDKPTKGLPLHVMNRAILECANVEEARATVERAGAGRSGNVMVGDASGDAFDYEFTGEETLEPYQPDGYLAHTNHFLGGHFVGPEPGYTNSISRMARARALADDIDDQSVDDLKLLLNDRASKDNPILRAYTPYEPLGKVGTVCTMVMDLKQRELHFRKGNNIEDGFEIYSPNQPLEVAAQ